MDSNRPDDPMALRSHEGRFDGGKALIVLGGQSGRDWERLRDEIRPDVILGPNGVNSEISGLDYWMCTENLSHSNKLASGGDESSARVMRAFHHESGAKTKLVSHRSWHLLSSTDRCLKIRRWHYNDDPETCSLRSYGEGYLSGWILRQPGIGVPVRVGTVGLHLLHHASLLGCREVHTIGFDLKFPSTSSHHWYSYPTYRVDRYRTSDMFCEYRGVKTQWFWVETALFLKSIENLFDRDHILWRDHSAGLLQVEGLRCASY